MGDVGSLPPLETLVRVLIAATVSDWVLERNHTSLPPRVMEGTIEMKAVEALLRPVQYFRHTTIIPSSC